MVRLAGVIVLGIILAGAIAIGGIVLARSLREDSRQTTLRVALASFGAEVLDPSMDTRRGLQYHGPMFDHLVGAAPDGRLDTGFGALERWESSVDAKTFTLTLRDGVRWHDGVEVTSADVEFSIGYYTREDATCGGCGRLRSALERVDVLDSRTVRLELNGPNVFFINNLGPVEGDTPLLAKHHWEEVGESGLAESPLGSGPWKYVERSLGQSIEYEANGDYWREDRVPGFDRLRLLLVPDVDMGLAMLRAGQVDMAVVRPAGAAFSPELAQGDVSALKAEGFTVQGPRYVTNTVLRFLMSYDPAYLTSRLEFRKALILGMNLPAIVKEIYPPEVATLRTGSPLTSPASVGYDPNLPAYPYDPDRAKELLEEMGYNGEKVSLFSIVAFGLAEVPLLNQKIAEEWRRIGLNVDIIQTDYSSIEARYYPRPQRFEDVGPAPLFHGVDYRPQPGFLNLVKRYMTSRDRTMLAYHDLEKGDRIYAELSAMADLDALDRRLREINRGLYEEYWAAPILWRHEAYGLSPGIQGWKPTDGTSSDLHLETVRPAR